MAQIDDAVMSKSRAVQRHQLINGAKIVKIMGSRECKNSPKNAFVEDFVVDLLAAKSLAGRVDKSASLPAVPEGLSEIEITHAISHGKVGAANGTLSISGSNKPFAAFIEFTSSKAVIVRSVTLYISQHSPDGGWFVMSAY